MTAPIKPGMTVVSPAGIHYEVRTVRTGNAARGDIAELRSQKSGITRSHYLADLANWKRIYADVNVTLSHAELEALVCACAEFPSREEWCDEHGEESEDEYWDMERRTSAVQAKLKALLAR